MQSFSEFIAESTALDREFNHQGFNKDRTGAYWHEYEELTKSQLHAIMTKMKFVELKKSLGDSRVSLPPNTHYMRDSMGSTLYATVEYVGKLGLVDRIRVKESRSRD